MYTQSDLGMQIRRLSAFLTVIHGPGWRLNRPAGCYVALRRSQEARLANVPHDLICGVLIPIVHLRGNTIRKWERTNRRHG